MDEYIKTQKNQIDQEKQIMKDIFSVIKTLDLQGKRDIYNRIMGMEMQKSISETLSNEESA